MLNDIARENRLKDRLEELKMLSLSDAGVHVSGGVDNKEGLAPWMWGWFGGGKARVAPETPKNQETTETRKDEDKSENKTSVEEYLCQIYRPEKQRYKRGNPKWNGRRSH